MASLTSSLPKTMRALFQLSPHSTTLTLKVVPLPVPTATEYLIRVHATALTNNELHWEANYPDVPTSPNKIPIPGYDISGVVVSAGSSATKFKPGDEIWSRVDFFHTGAAAEYVAIEEKELALKSKKLGWIEASTVPMSALTAWQALFDHGGLKAVKGEGAKGKRVFVTAAAGSVGRWVVAFAKWAGAEVFATASARDEDEVKKLGAIEVLDYRTADVKGWVKADESARKVDLVIDNIGGSALRDAWWTVKSGGAVISIFAGPESEKPEGVSEGVRTLFFVMVGDGEVLGRISELIDENGWTGKVDSVWKLEEYEQAVEKLENGKPKGKVVFDLGVVG